MLARRCCGVLSQVARCRVTAVTGPSYQISILIARGVANSSRARIRIAQLEPTPVALAHNSTRSFRLSSTQACRCERPKYRYLGTSVDAGTSKMASVDTIMERLVLASLSSAASTTVGTPRRPLQPNGVQSSSAPPMSLQSSN